MRILLITYDFPPECSPRSLRWRYLVRELVLLGHEVHVLCPDLGAIQVDFPQAPGRLLLHRGFPGPYGCLVRHSRSKPRPSAPVTSALDSGQVAPKEPRLNWRGRVVDAAKRCCALFMYPDIRAEWVPWARRRLRRLLRDAPPDVVITSHEPALSLPMGRWAQRKGFRWVADLGDPVCADYTPRRWRRRAWRLEAMVCRHADKVLVTTEATRQLLIDRHQQDPARCAVLPNGYDDRCTWPHDVASPVDFDAERLELIHSGRMYTYRDPSGLLEAVRHADGVRLTLILPDPPEGWLADMLRDCGDNIRVLGPMPHDAVMQTLRGADVLVNIGNVGKSVQVPAKVYEYLGIARPILHVVPGMENDDVVAGMLRPMSRGWVCASDPQTLSEPLRDMRKRKQQGRLGEGLDLQPLASHAHSTLGRKLGALLTEVRDGASH